jgi:hypothetical protein
MTCPLSRATARRTFTQRRKRVETNGLTVSLSMPAAGRVDCAAAGLILGMHEIAKLGLSGKIEPISSRSAMREAFNFVSPGDASRPLLAMHSRTP